MDRTRSALPQPRPTHHGRKEGPQGPHPIPLPLKPSLHSMLLLSLALLPAVVVSTPLSSAHSVNAQLSLHHPAPPHPLLLIQNRQQQPQAAACINKVNLADFQSCLASCDTSKGACAASSCCIVVQGPIITVCYNDCCQIQNSQTAITSFASSNICTSSSNNNNNTSNTNPAAATPSVQDVFPGGPTCSIPQDRTSAFDNCVQSCSLNSQTCTAQDCCVTVSSQFTTYCLGTCCGSFSHNTGQVRFAESAACTPAAQVQSTPVTTVQPITTTTMETASPAATPLPIPVESIVPTPRANSSASSSSNKTSSSCFPAHALVQLASGALRRMDQLAVGDRVRVGHSHFSDVFMFTHQSPEVTANFVHLHATTGHQLILTHGHYVYANGALVPASTVKVGDTLLLGSGNFATVNAVSEVLSRGLFNPQTLDGDIVVNGITASTYTTAVSPAVGHAWLAPLRYLYSTLGLSTALFANGADDIANLLPIGPAKC